MTSLSLVHNVVKPSQPDSNDRFPLLLLLHGYGSNENDLVELSPHLDQRFLVISVRAPLTLAPNMFAWFPTEFLPGGISVNVQDAKTARQKLETFFEEVLTHYPVDAKKVFIMGFSQGAVMSYILSLLNPGRVSATVAMSGRMPPQEFLNNLNRQELENFPIFACHGIYDDVISINSGRECKAALEKMPVNLTYREYDMAHQVSYESLNDISQWLTAQLNTNKTKS